ncbi:MAG: Vng1746c [uncultured Chloroflexi bacterium]|uniref:Vng1746c n=1 Tax=uncultured Chloroflexota bacterium TaxID=166587 RepID=A0A6J4JUQ0_9CHLR|nr:MAG: Vng1746c [uncultured Chloroflexota bacterium]
MSSTTSPAGVPTIEDRIAPTRRPPATSIMRQNWRSLLFLHWEVPVDVLRPLVPAQLSIDTFEGRAYIGVTPFVVRDARPRLLPAVPGLSDFNELNVRTYVHYGGRDPGVWFFSLDASNLPAVLAARATFRLPYCHADMEVVARSTRPQYRSERKRFGRTPATFEASARLGEHLGSAQLGTLEHFFIERYLLYTRWVPGEMLVGQVHHRPYPLQRAEVEHVSYESLLRADGLPPPAEAPSEQPHVLFSPGVDVEVFPLRAPGSSTTYKGGQGTGSWPWRPWR